MKSLIFLLLCATYLLPAQVSLRGLVTEKDSSGFLSFAYIICKGSGHGTMSDHEGRFALVANEADTIICSYMGYTKGIYPVKALMLGNTNKVVLRMIAMPINLGPVTVSTFKIKPYERDYMNDIIERSTLRKMDYVSSPISALYMQYSKEGRQVRKLAKIFEQLLIEEEVQKKLSRELLVRLTGDDKIDYAAFRKYCYYVSDYFIVNHDGVELYSRVMDCYRHWKAEGRDQPPRLREREKPQN